MGDRCIHHLIDECLPPSIEHPEATLLGIVRDEKQGTAIILDRTIFHPQGGGQPSDQGKLIVRCCEWF